MSDSFRDLANLCAERLARRSPLRLTGLRGAARGAVGARLVEAAGGRTTLFLAADSKAADALLEDLRTALGEPPAEEGGRVRAFPHHDTAPYDRFSPQAFVTAQRMDVLHRLADHAEAPGDGPAPVIVAPWTALALRVPSRADVRARTSVLRVGGRIDRDELIARLVAAGYTRQPLVEERGEVAVRGGIVDVFPPQRARPVRVELMDDEIESLREFDAASQRSERTLERVVLAPARELLLDRDLVVERGDALRALAEEQGIASPEIDALMDALLRGSPPPGVECLGPLLQHEVETVSDFLGEDALLVIDEPASGRERLLRHAEDAEEGFEAARVAGRPALPPDQLMVDAEALLEELRRRKPVTLESLDVADPADPGYGGEHVALGASGQDELRAELTRTRSHPRALSALADAIDAWLEQGLRVVLAAPALSGAERIARLLADYDHGLPVIRRQEPCWRWAQGRVEVRVARLSAGFQLPGEQLVVVTEEEIFGPRQKRRRAADWRDSKSAPALAQLSPDDHLVHAEHGIGIYRGLIPLTLGGIEGEFLRLEYEGGDRLFLPVHRLNLVQRYVAADGEHPKLDRLGGSTWEKTKQAVRKSVKVLAGDLLSVHAARELAPGFAFSPRDGMMREFEGAFPFEETPDQASAIEDVLEDLQHSRPMDRLVCGDVGYGKTEVAARAAFKAVMDGKQVAVLVPTTVLCQQHTETFEARFDGYPVRVASLSRFQKPKASREIVEGLISGAVDIVIGTHRLLQKQIAFRDLGLLVVDEEHRFGVAHKERIKQLKKTVDVLTLTATPIPRTLQMAFSGLRDLSVINTPPADRLAIRTQVCRFDESLIREAILREVRRGGQVFFVHNRVRSINSIAEWVGRVVPEVSVLVAHGQMPERELEQKMLAFLHGEADLLLCTTIIESGLDVPRANTILIDRADALGLAQLYQLRGRVGRSSRRAYAYLMIPGEDALSTDAKRRMMAIQDLSELGSGFRLANMDLEIRGAGNLLGGEQSGNLLAVGYETYMQLLEEALEELRGNPVTIEIDPEIRLPVAARLPEDYVPEINQRLVLYKQLAGAGDPAEIEQVRDELLDRYGPLPTEARQLVELCDVKLLARRRGIAAVDVVRGHLVLTAGAGAQVDPRRLVDLIQDSASGVYVASDQRIHARLGSTTPEALFERARSLLEALG